MRFFNCIIKYKNNIRLLHTNNVLYLSYKHKQKEVLKKVLKSMDQPNHNTNKHNNISIDNEIMDYILKHEIAKTKHKGTRGKARRNINMDPRRYDKHIYHMFRNKIRRVAVASRPAQFPNIELPEIAFAGRSNVGKSSLLKSLSLRLVRTEVDDRPGTTRSLIFFVIPKQLTIVDLPGYGFAYANKSEQTKWSNVMSKYFKDRQQLKRVLIIVDSRHGLKNNDRELIKLLDAFNVKFQCIMTKCDLILPKDLAQKVLDCQEEIKLYKNSIKRVLMVSSLSKAGVPELMKQLSGLMENLNKKEPSKLRDKDVLNQKLVPIHLGLRENIFKTSMKKKEKEMAKVNSIKNSNKKNTLLNETSNIYPLNFNPVSIISEAVNRDDKSDNIANESNNNSDNDSNNSNSFDNNDMNINDVNNNKINVKKKKPKKVIPKPIRKKLSLREKYAHLL